MTLKENKHYVKDIGSHSAICLVLLEFYETLYANPTLWISSYTIFDLLLLPYLFAFSIKNLSF